MSQSGIASMIASGGGGSGTVTSVTGTAFQVAVANPTTTPVISLIGPYTPATFGAHGVLLGEGTSSIVATAVGTTGQVLTGVTGADPVWASPATSGTVTSVSGTAFQVAVATGTTTPVISLIGPYTPSTYTAHGVILGEGTASMVATSAGTSGQLFQSGGASADGTWTTATFPSAAGTNLNILQSNGTNFTSVAFPGITTINGDSGSITGSTVTIFANTSANPTGKTVKFTNSSTTSTLSLTDASDNIFIGRVAGNGTYTGTQNVGLGTACFNSLTGGGNNAAVGYISQQLITSGTQNASLGYSALHSNTTGVSNTAIGYQALTGLTGANSNTAVGSGCLQSLTTGANNIAIGVLAGANYTTTESSNILINVGGTVGESNTLRIGVNGTGAGQVSTCFIAGITGVTVTGTAVLCSTSGQLGTIASSRRYKENITSMSEDVSIMNLRAVEFNYISDEKKTKQYGLIAEEVNTDFPYLCFYNDEGKPESVKYHELPVFLLKEIQRLNKRIEALEKV